jgi:hypothetical protein
VFWPDLSRLKLVEAAALGLAALLAEAGPWRNLRRCPECRTYFLNERKKGAPRKYCLPPAECASIAHQRQITKHKNKKSEA